LEPEDLIPYRLDEKIVLHKGALAFSDAAIVGSEELRDDLQGQLKEFKNPSLEFQQPEAYLSAYMEFYNSLLEQEVE